MAAAVSGESEEAIGKRIGIDFRDGRFTVWNQMPGYMTEKLPKELQKPTQIDIADPKAFDKLIEDIKRRFIISELK